MALVVFAMSKLMRRALSHKVVATTMQLLIQDNLSSCLGIQKLKKNKVNITAMRAILLKMQAI